MSVWHEKTLLSVHGASIGQSPLHLSQKFIYPKMRQMFSVAKVTIYAEEDSCYILAIFLTAFGFVQKLQL